MAIKNPAQLHPRGEAMPLAVQEELVEIFDPEAGKSSDNPFGEHTAPSKEQVVDPQEDPLEEAVSTKEVSKYDEEDPDRD